MPYEQAGLKAVTIGSFGRSSLAVHTGRDTMDKVNARFIEATARLAMEILSNLDRSLQHQTRFDVQNAYGDYRPP